MTLDEGIKRAEEVMIENLERVKSKNASNPIAIYFSECADESRQLAEWLKELKAYREREPSYEAGYNDAKREIALSGEYERAYKRGKSDAGQAQWIPVSEGLPEDKTYVLVTIAVRGRQPHSRSSWYQKGAFHNDNGDYWRADEPEVVAWMPLPKPYMEEVDG